MSVDSGACHSRALRARWCTSDGRRSLEVAERQKLEAQCSPRTRAPRRIDLGSIVEPSAITHPGARPGGRRHPSHRSRELDRLRPERTTRRGRIRRRSALTSSVCRGHILGPVRGLRGVRWVGRGWSSRRPARALRLALGWGRLWFPPMNAAQLPGGSQASASSNHLSRPCCPPTGRHQLGFGVDPSVIVTAAVPLSDQPPQ